MPPDDGTPPRTGNGLILGRVIDADSGRPIAGAQVRLQLPAEQNALARLQSLPESGPPIVPAMVEAGGPSTVFNLTNAEGQFVFTQLPPGNYGVVAIKPGYANGAFARTRPEGPSRPLELDDNERVADVSIRLWKHAVISGTVSDPSGEPAIGVQVRALRSVPGAGGRRVGTGGTAMTDDRGSFRFFGLIPGEYLIVVPATFASAPVSSMDQVQQVMTSGDSARMTQFMREAGPAGASLLGSGGRQVGDQVVQHNTASSGLTADANGRMLMTPTTYYPAGTQPARADRIRLASGEERSGVTIQLPLVPAVSVSGTLTGPDGPVALAAVRMVPSDLTGFVSDTGFETATTITDGRGTFTFPAVPAGQYTIHAARVPRPTAPSPPAGVTFIQSGGSIMTMAGGDSVARTPPPAPTDPVLTAEAVITVADAPLHGLALTFRSGARVSGTVEFRGNAAITPGTQRAVTVTLIPIDGRRLPAGYMPGRASAEGTFATMTYPPGRYVISATGPAGWSVESATVAGRDVLDTPFELGENDLSGAVVVLSNRTSMLAGSVRNSSGGRGHAVVMIFPADYQSWIANGMSARRSRTLLADDAGAFLVGGLPAGDYLVVALPPETTVELANETVAALASAATRVSVGGTGTTSVTVGVSAVR